MKAVQFTSHRFEGSAVYSLDMDGTEDLLEGDRGKHFYR